MIRILITPTVATLTMIAYDYIAKTRSPIYIYIINFIVILTIVYFFVTDFQ